MRRGSSAKLWSFRPSVSSFVGPISRVGLSRSYVAQRPVPSSSSMCAPAACIVSPSRCFSDQAPRSGSKDTEKKAESTATPEKHKKEHLSQVWSEKFNTFVQELKQSNQQQMGSDQRKKLQEEMGFFLRKFSKLRLVPLLDRATQMGVTDKDLTPYLHPRVVAEAYSGLGQHGKALDLLKPLLSGQQPTVADYDVAIKICGGIEDHGKAMTLWDDLLAKGLEPTVSTYTSILSCCSTPAHVETTALRVRKEMKARNLTPTSSYYYQLIRAYHKANIPHKVISTFHTMESKDKIVPDPYTTSFALMAYGKEKRLDLIKSTMAQLKEKGFVPPTSTYNAYLLAAAYAGDYDHALDMLRNMEKYPDDYATPDSSTYDSLITACGEVGHLEKAWAVLKRMNKNGFRPSRRTMQNFVSICLAQNRKEQLLEVLRLMKKLEIAWESHTYNALITFYANNDDLESALKVLENMKRNASENLAGRRVVVAEDDGDLVGDVRDGRVVPNIHSYNILLKHFVRMLHERLATGEEDDPNKARFLAESTQRFHQMMLNDSKTFNFRLDETSYGHLFRFYGQSLDDQPMVLQLYSDMKKDHVPNSSTNANLVRSIMSANLRLEYQRNLP